jgi:hypothetical protein
LAGELEALLRLARLLGMLGLARVLWLQRFADLSRAFSDTGFAFHLGLGPVVVKGVRVGLRNHSITLLFAGRHIAHTMH